MNPRGYLYYIDENIQECYIGVSSIPDSKNQFRLGKIFLWNFYTVLDYDQNLIKIGVNVGSKDIAKAEIDGGSTEKTKAKNGTGYLYILEVSGILTLVFGFYKLVQHKRKSHTVDPESECGEEGEVNTGIQDESAESFIVPKDSFTSNAESIEKQADLFTDPGTAKPEQAKPKEIIEDSKIVLTPLQASATIVNLVLATGPFTYPQGFVLLGPVLSLFLLAMTTFIAYVTATFMIEAIAVSNAM